jgi:hypothetical protein
MTHAIPVIAAILGCLALIFLLTYLFADPHWKAAIRYTAWRWHLKLRAGWRSLRADLAGINAAYRQSLRERDPAPLLACRDTKPRVRRPAAAARPGGPPPSPAPGAGRARGVPVADVAALHATRDDLLALPRNGVLLPDRLREQPEPMPFRIPPYYAAYEAEKARWLP